MIEKAWRRRNVIWLAGVRRVGKTFLSQSLANVEYFDCELPRVRRVMDDPEGFLDGMAKKRVVLDEIHRLDNPTQMLKIAADHYKTVQILATGSSTLGASSKFKDTLTDRKTNIWLTPMMSADLDDFKNADLEHRFLRGGLPPFFLNKDFPERSFQEWMDDYWAKDIQTLFHLERQSSFQKFAELLFAQSGGIFEASRFASPCEVSRQTIANYLKVLEATFVALIIRPFSQHRPTEIISAPKVYAFDTGFVCYYRGWDNLRREDMGIMWEHFVLNEICAHMQTRRVLYWRDKRGHEVDFVLVPHGGKPMAIECKWRADDFEPKNIKAFRKRHPEGDNIVVVSDVDKPFKRRYGEIVVNFEGLSSFIRVATNRQVPIS